MRNKKLRSQKGSQRASSSRTRKWVYLETGLITIGVLCISVYLSACAQRSLFQSTESHSFDHELTSRIQTETPNQKEWSSLRIERFDQIRHQNSPSSQSAVGRLVIPKADVEVMVLHGTDEETLDRGVGLIEGTAKPGDGSNVGIAGHRDSYFRGLRHLRAGDEIELATLKGLTRYEVSEILIVEPEYVQVLNPTAESSLTLVTCYPFYHVGSAPQRYIVRAKEVDFEEWTPVRVARFTASPVESP